MERQSSELYRTLSRRFPRAAHDDVEEAIREAAVVGYLADHNVQGTIRNHDAFATTVARRNLSRELRRQSKLVRPEAEEYISWEDVDREATQHSDQEEQHASTIDARDIMGAMPSAYAQVMRMHYLDGLTLDESAQLVGVSAACMRKRHERALKWARKRFR